MGPPRGQKFFHVVKCSLFFLSRCCGYPVYVKSSTMENVLHGWVCIVMRLRLLSLASSGDKLFLFITISK